jgi:hypothetical protein
MIDRDTRYGGQERLVDGRESGAVPAASAVAGVTG